MSIVTEKHVVYYGFRIKDDAILDWLGRRNITISMEAAHALASPKAVVMTSGPRGDWPGSINGSKSGNELLRKHYANREKHTSGDWCVSQWTVNCEDGTSFQIAIGTQIGESTMIELMAREVTEDANAI